MKWLHHSPGHSPRENLMSDHCGAHSQEMYGEETLHLENGKTPDCEFGIEVKCQRKRGLYVLQVDTDSLAENLGLKTGDTIVALNGLDVRTMRQAEVSHIIRGETITSLTYKREDIAMYSPHSD